MTEISADLFEGVRDAQISTLPDKPKEGRYLVRLDEIRQRKTGNAQGKKLPKTFLSIGYTVLAVVQSEEGQSAHRVGDVCAYTLWKDGHEWAPTYFQRDLKQFLVGIDPESDPNSVTEDEFIAGCMSMISDDQPLKGWVVEMKTWPSYSKRDLDDEGDPRPGAKRYVNVEWLAQLDKERILAEVDEVAIKRFQVLTD